MNLKLLMASFWMPDFLLIPELDKVAEVTVSCLNQILKKHAPNEFKSISKDELLLEGNIKNRRKQMALAHNIRVKLLINALGWEDALMIGRKSLFKAGMQLGREARERLGVGDNFEDLIRAARILYHVLGIEFRIKRSEEDILIIVERCSLSNYYTHETCKILSAADEGVVQGLNENIHMKFTQRMTEGYKECEACINYIKNQSFYL